MIRFARPSDHPRLKTLWADVFGDPPASVNDYFTLRHRDEHMLVDEQDGRVIAMLSMLPVALTSGGQTFPARYIYGVATDPRWRGQGISTALLAAAHEHMQSRQAAASLLVPASPELFAFYEKRDYVPCFFYDILTLSADDLPSAPGGAAASSCGATAYTQMRNEAFSQSGLFVRWEERDVDYAMRTFAQEGGVTRLRWNGGEACAAWERMKDGVLVRELALLHGSLHEAISVLHNQLRAPCYTLRLAQGTVSGATLQPFGMIHWLSPPPALSGPPPYLSLAMD